MALLPGLMSYWTMDEASGTRFDSKGSNNLTDVNTVTSGAGIINNAAIFTLANSETLTNASITLAEPFSFSFWGWQNASIATAQRFFVVGGTLFIFIPLSTTTVRITNTGSVTATGFTAGAWHHVVCVQNGASSAVYVDNVKTAGTASGPATGLMSLGSYIGTTYLDGKMDEAGMWSGRALADADVAALWNGGVGLAYPFGESLTGAKSSKFRIGIGTGI